MTYTVIATGKVAPYTKGEEIETIKGTKAVTKAIKSGHVVKDSEGNRLEVVNGEIIRY